MVEKNNWEILSLTRFLLALVVMVGHLKEFSSLGFLKFYANLGAFQAILGFLLISGLSIGKSIAKNQDSYFKRRIQRIYPVYLASIVYQILVVGVTPSFWSVLVLSLNVLFLNQIFTDVSFVSPAWTLALEVWLYSLAPVFLKMKRKSLLYLIFISFGSYILYTCGRTLLHFNYYSGTKYGVNLLLLAFIWIAGFVLAIFPADKKHNARVIAILFIGHLAVNIGIQILARVKNHQLSQIVSVDLISFVGSAVCLAFVYYVVIYNQKIPTFKPLTNKIFNLLGNISYPLYLSHLTTFHLLNKFKINNQLLMIVSALVVSYVIYAIFDFYSKKRIATN